MKGSPLLRAIVAFLLIASVGLPLWRLTRPAEVLASPTAAPTDIRPILLELTFSSPPAYVAVLHLGKAVWKKDAPGMKVEHAAQIEFPPEGVDLQFAVRWPPGESDSALRVRLTDPDGSEHERTVWGRGEMLETVTFP